MVIALVPPDDDAEPPLPLLARARLLMYPYIHRDDCVHCYRATHCDNPAGCDDCDDPAECDYCNDPADCDESECDEKQPGEDDDRKLERWRYCRWDDAIVGRQDVFRGRLWVDRYGRRTPDRPFADPEDEIRPAADVNLRNALRMPEAVVTPDGELHLPRTLAHAEDLIASYGSCVAVPFSCHF